MGIIYWKLLACFVVIWGDNFCVDGVFGGLVGGRKSVLPPSHLYGGKKRTFGVEGETVCREYPTGRQLCGEVLPFRTLSGAVVC